MDQWINQRENEKIHAEKLKWKHNNPKSLGCSKSVLRGKFIAIRPNSGNKRNLKYTN